MPTVAVVQNNRFSYLGEGLGFRPSHFNQIQNDPGQVQWFEFLAENFMGISGHGQSPLIKMLEKIRENFPVVFHCVSLNLGSVDEIDTVFLKRLKEFCDIFEPSLVSDHLCWTGAHGRNSHELLPLPYTQEAIDVVSRNINIVQDILERPFLIENTSSYVSYKNSEMTEWQFINEILNRTNGGLLLDLNNVYVSSVNHDYDSYEFLKSIDLNKVGQIHLAGHEVRDNGLLIDTHSKEVCDEVWEMLRFVLKIKSDISVMVEWDNDLPAYNKLLEELSLVQRIRREA